MNNFFYSDAHFYHDRIRELCDRPYSSMEDMNESLISNINNTVGVDDNLYHLGDFCFSNIDNVEDIINRINCDNQYFILGNHDQVLLNGRGKLIRNPKVKKISSYMELSLKNSKNKNVNVCLFHYPMRSWNKQHYGSYALFGHMHGRMEPHGRSVDVGIDSPYILGEIPYRPFSFNEIATFMESRDIIRDF